MERWYNGYMKTRIVRNPKILAGKPVIAGTRIPVTLILNLLAHGMTVEGIMDEYDITKEQVQAAIQFAQKDIERNHPAQTVALHEIYSRRKFK